MRIPEFSPKQIALTFAFLLVGGYAIFQARFIILGPRLSVYSPANGAHLSNNVVTLSGRAQNVSSLSLDDQIIYTDQNGNWSDKLIAPDGLSIMTLQAKDRFGRETQKQIEILVE